MSSSRALLFLAFLACGGGAASSTPAEEATPGGPTEPPGAPTTPGTTPPAPSGPVPTLDVKFLGVGGLLIEVGKDSVLTSPLYTRPSFTQVMGGQAVASDDANVAKDLTAAQLEKVRAILSGHAHYDHLLDTPGVMQRAANATLYANVSAKRLLAAYAPDRAPACDGTPAAAKPIARSRIVALDDPAASVVDYRACPNLKPPGAPLDGTWVTVPGANVRLLSICSEHPDQFGPVHFAPGEVTEDACVPPPRMDAWKEGRTLAFLIDFLDAAGKPLYRVYYQDAPTTVPTGLPPAAILAEKRIDVTLLTLGSANNVPGSPTTTLQALSPRYAIGHHWEDFFLSSGGPAQPIAFLNVDDWKTKGTTALPASGEPTPMKHNGATAGERVVVPQPGDWFTIAAP
jgi:hypothetical protein